MVINLFLAPYNQDLVDLLMAEWSEALLSTKIKLWIKQENSVWLLSKKYY